MVPSSRQIWSQNRGLLHPTVAIPHPLPTFLSRHPHPSTQPPQWNVLTVTCPPFFSPSSALSRFREMLKMFVAVLVCHNCWNMVSMLPVSHELHPLQGMKPTRTICTIVISIIVRLCYGCVVSFATNRHNSTTSQSYREPNISAYCWH